MNDASEKLGQRIKWAMTARGESQSSLARLLGITPAAVGKWVNGESEPSRENLRKLADKLDVSVAFLLTESALSSGKDLPAIKSVAERQGAKLMVIKLADAWKYVNGEKVTPIGWAMAHFECGNRSFSVALDDQSNSPTFESGHRVVLDPDIQPRPGDMVMAYLPSTDEVLFRKYTLKGLQALSPDYQLPDTEQQSFKLIGVMTEHARGRAS